ncbi:MAG: Asp-tRNA(Asn)/Glu-tRNA(Gln) amidotransferase subunit GatC [Methanomicrobiales archaeon]|nr:Asp-tRNA(Asn)/Glu-tRNA(Gln) amidotransferase subunit GatC [Methanomicrobiales archaeon]
MVTQKDVVQIANLADVGIREEELDAFTVRFNTILEYFDILDQVPEGTRKKGGSYNVFRDDTVEKSLPHEEVVGNAGDREDGYIKAPRVM